MTAVMGLMSLGGVYSYQRGLAAVMAARDMLESRGISRASHRCGIRTQRIGSLSIRARGWRVISRSGAHSDDHLGEGRGVHDRGTSVSRYRDHRNDFATGAIRDRFASDLRFASSTLRARTNSQSDQEPVPSRHRALDRHRQGRQNPRDGRRKTAIECHHERRARGPNPSSPKASLRPRLHRFFPAQPRLHHLHRGPRATGHR